ncbi:MAG: C2 domain-containing protein [Deltaproteobacteria bacterium]
MKLRTGSTTLLVLTLSIGCGTGDDGGDDVMTPDTTCFDVTASCGQTIGGALCTSSNGGSCVGGTLCSATGACELPPCDPLAPASCSGETVCIDGSCVSAFPRFYVLTVGAVTVASRDANDECWDVGCGAPDPFAVVMLNDERIGATTTRQDVFEATFDEAFDLEMTAGSEVAVLVGDEDISENDLVLSCVLSSIDGDTIRGRAFVCDGENSVRFSIVPR